MVVVAIKNRMSRRYTLQIQRCDEAGYVCIYEPKARQRRWSSAERGLQAAPLAVEVFKSLPTKLAPVDSINSQESMISNRLLHN
jgi:hypothetical protein